MMRVYFHKRAQRKAGYPQDARSRRGTENALALRVVASDANGGQPPYPRSISGQMRDGSGLIC